MPLPIFPERLGEPLKAPAVPSVARPALAARLVAVAADHAWSTAALGVLLAAVATVFVATHFSLNSDTDQLISWKLPWRQNEAAFNRLFHTEGDQIVTVIDGATPEIAEQAAADLTSRLQSRPDLFRFVSRPDAGPYFAREGLLFQDVAEVRDQMAQLVKAQPFLGPLAADPSLRGLAGTISTALKGVGSGDAKLADLARPIGALGRALDDLEAGKPVFFSWRALISGKAPGAATCGGSSWPARSSTSTSCKRAPIPSPSSARPPTTTAWTSPTACACA